MIQDVPLRIKYMVEFSAQFLPAEIPKDASLANVVMVIESSENEPDQLSARCVGSAWHKKDVHLPTFAAPQIPVLFEPTTSQPHAP
jgi:hypothetical protein